MRRMLLLSKRGGHGVNDVAEFDFTNRSEGRRFVKRRVRRAFRHSERAVVEEGLEDLFDVPKPMTRREREAEKAEAMWARTEALNKVNGYDTGMVIHLLIGRISYESDHVLGAWLDEDACRSECARLVAALDLYNTYESKRWRMGMGFKDHGADEPARPRYDGYYMVEQKLLGGVL